MAHGGPKFRGGSADKRAKRAAPKPAKKQTKKTHGTATKKKGK